MIRRQILAALLVVVSLAVTIPCVAQQSPIEKEIRDLEDKMNAAYAANDLPVYFAYYADDSSAVEAKSSRLNPSDMKIQIGPWFKRDGKWKVVHLHYSPSPNKK
jgi:ketosteroid isomerase-like protein